MKRSRNLKLFSMLLVLALLFSCTACAGSGDTVLITCNGYSVTESTFKLLMIEQATGLWGQEGITEENLVDKAKEAVLDYLPAYTYYVQGYKAAGYTLSEEDSGQLRVNVLSGLIDSGLAYDVSKKDEAFLNTFGVTFEQYMDYQEEAYLISYFYQEELKKVKVEETLTKAYFEEHQAAYAICTADILRYPKAVDGETEASAMLAKSQLEAGGTFEDCKGYTGWDKAETLTFDYSSNLDATFGEGFVQSMVASEQGKVLWLETDTFITVARLTVLAGYTENLEVITDIVKEDVYAGQLAETLTIEAYTPQIVNRVAYDAIDSIPGSDLV